MSFPSTAVSVSGPVDVAVREPAEGGTVAEIGPGLSAKYPGARQAGSGGFLSPGLVCSHTHLYSALARGILADLKPSKDFGQILAHLWWRLDRAIDEPVLRASARAGLADAALCGVTSVVDHHASPSFIDGSLDVIKAAYDEIGLKGLVCYETTDRNGMEGARAGVRENVRFARAMDMERKAGAQTPDRGRDRRPCPLHPRGRDPGGSGGGRAFHRPRLPRACGGGQVRRLRLASPLRHGPGRDGWTSSGLSGRKP